MENYEVTKTLGRGSYGRVDLAKNRTTGENFAIKKVKLGHMSETDRLKALDEATFLSKLDHPNIVSYQESFQESNSLFIVMEYMDGGDLEKKIAQRGHSYLTEQEILFSFVQVLSALNYLHKQKILHRDIKPQNCFLTRHAVVKLGDFGVARSLDNNLMAKTVIGTPFYLAPEIWDNAPYSYAADVYSLGVVLYELCSLKKPFEAETAPELLIKVMKGEHSPVPEFFSRDLKELLSAMMKRDPNLRPTCDQIVQLPFIQKAIKELVEFNKNQKPEKKSVPKTLFSPKNSGGKKRNPFGQQMGRGRLLMANVINNHDEKEEEEEEEKQEEFEDDFIEDDFIDDNEDEEAFHLLEVVTSRLQESIIRSSSTLDPFKAENLRERLVNRLGLEKLNKIYGCLKNLKNRENKKYVESAENEDKTAVDEVRELIQLETIA